MTPARLTTLVGYSALARYMARLPEDPLGEIPCTREYPAARYSFGPSYTVYGSPMGVGVVLIETAHRRFEVWTVDPASVQPLGTL